MRGFLDRWLGLVDPGKRTRWAALVLLALVVSAFEMAGALLVLLVLRIVTEPQGDLELPVIGDLRARFSQWDDVELFTYLAVFVAGFFLVRGVLTLFQSYMQARVTQNAGVSLSRRLLNGYLRMPYAAHLRRNSAELIRNAQTSVDEIVQSLFVPAVRLCSQILLVAGILVILLFAAPVATLLAALILGPLVAGMLGGIQPRVAKLGEISQALSRVSLLALQQSLHGFRDIKVLGRERFFEQRFHRSRAGMARTRYLRLTLKDVPRVVVETALILFILVFLVVTLRTGRSPRESLSVLGLFAYAALRVMPSLNRIVVNINDLRFGSAAIDDVLADLDAIRRDAVPARAGVDAAPLPFNDELELHEVSFRYPAADDDALRGIDLAIRPGESIGLVGPTGGGKSTLVDVILGLLPPTTGSVTVDGVDLPSNAAAWQLNCGVVPQSVFLLDDTIRRNIALGLPDADIDEAALRDAVRLAQLEDFVASLPDGFDTMVGERGLRISGGQRQRVAIARALYRKPRVLILDEGTSALDNVTESVIIEALETLPEEVTTITVAHRLTTVRRSDRLVFISQGRVTDVGTYDDLVERNDEFRHMTV